MRSTSSNSYGPAFNRAGGGWYAIERTSESIKIWFWSRQGWLAGTALSLIGKVTCRHGMSAPPIPVMEIAPARWLGGDEGRDSMAPPRPLPDAPPPPPVGILPWANFCSSCARAGDRGRLIAMAMRDCGPKHII